MPSRCRGVLFTVRPSVSEFCYGLRSNSSSPAHFVRFQFTSLKQAVNSWCCALDQSTGFLKREVWIIGHKHIPFLQLIAMDYDCKYGNKFNENNSKNSHLGSFREVIGKSREVVRKPGKAGIKNGPLDGPQLHKSGWFFTVYREQITESLFRDGLLISHQPQRVPVHAR